MEVSFATKKLAKLGNSEREMRSKLGVNCGKKLAKRLKELSGVDCLEDMRYLTGARCHELKGNRKGQLAVDLEHPKRLIFEPDHEPAPKDASGGLDWKAVTKIVVVEIVNYH